MSSDACLFCVLLALPEGSDVPDAVRCGVAVLGPRWLEGVCLGCRKILGPIVLAHAKAERARGGG